MADDELDQWLRDRRPREPLAHNLSMLDGFVSAVVAGPVSMEAPFWICPLLAIDRGAFNTGGTPEFAAIKAVADRHNAITQHLQDGSGLKPVYHQKPNREVDAADWCEGFLAAVKLNQPLWNDLLNLDNIHHGLLLPILLYCKDSKGQPMLGPPREGPQTERFLSQAYTDIPPVVAAMREYFQEQRFGRPHPNARARS
jgi:uncharacterized protein